MHRPESLDGRVPASPTALDAATRAAPGTAAPGTAAPGTAAPGTGRWDWLGAAAARPTVRHLALLACYIAAGIAVTWPRTGYLTSRLPAVDDVSSYVWDLWWVTHQVTHLGNPWFTSQMAAPAGIQLGFDTTMPLAGLAMTPVTLAFGPSASLALLTAVTPGLACYAMYRVARLWLRSQAGAIAAGAFFGLSTMLTFQNWYHLNIAIGAIFLPMALEASVRLRRCPGRGQGVILGVVLGASVLVNIETAVMALFLAALVLVPGLFRAPGAGRLASVAVGALVCAVVASPQLIAMVHQASTAGVAGADVHGYVKYAAQFPGLFAPSPRLADFGMRRLAAISRISKSGDGIADFGVVLSLLAVLGLAAAWRRRSAWLLALLWLGSSILALGPTMHFGSRHYAPLRQLWGGVPVSQLMPYTWLVHLPGFSGFREAERFALLGLVAAALLAGRAVDWLRYHAGQLIIVVVALSVLEAGWSGTPRIGIMPAARPALDRPIAADHSGSIVVDVPFGLRGGLGLYGKRIAPDALLAATADGHPRAVAYVSWVPAPTTAAINAHPFYSGLVAAQTGHQASPAGVAAARQDARRLDVGWVLVWPTSDPAAIRHLPAAIRYLIAAGFRFDYRADGVSVYRPAARG